MGQAKCLLRLCRRKKNTFIYVTIFISGLWSRAQYKGHPEFRKPTKPKGIDMAAPEDEGKISSLPVHDDLVGGEFVEIIVPQVGNPTGFENKRIAAEKLGGAQTGGLLGCVYITDVEPANPIDNVGNKVKTADSHTMVSCSTSTQIVRITVEAIAGPGAFTPVITLNGAVNVPMVRVGTDGVLFRGTATIDLNTLGSAPYAVVAEHGDGGDAQVTIAMDSAPGVDTARFTGGYPAGQTEVKAGDVLSINFSTDSAVVAYEIKDAGAFVAASGNLTPGTIHTVAGLVVADRGNLSQNLGFQLRVKKASGTWSPWFNTASSGTQADGVSYVKLNNIYPVITMGTITYPLGKEALDSGNVAVINHTVVNANGYTYSSPGAQLTVTNPAVFEAAKSVTQLGGTYNESIANFQLVARRTSNGASTVATAVVKIASVAPQVSVSTPAARLRSGGNNGTAAQDHTVTLTSNQALVEAPSLNVPEGTWKGNWTPDVTKKIWTRLLTIHDDDDKGTFSFNSLSAKSLSGRVVTTLQGSADYVIGGFVFRTLTVPAYPNRQVAIGTKVVDTAKLRCSNLSKGATGSLNFTYQATQSPAADRYTVLTENTWYNADNANATSNTGGTMQIELEEAI
ncbi:hypothetical protein D3C84_163330 [compost metagenome]